MRVWPYDLRVAGLTFKVKSMDEVDSDAIECRREPTNEFDSRAVAVYCIYTGKKEPKHVGYIPKEIARNIPDEKLPCNGQVVWKTDEIGRFGMKIAI